MFETPITVVGNSVNDPHGRRVGDQEVIKFRVASNSRRRTADGTWEAGNSLFVTVNCWGRLATRGGAALSRSTVRIIEKTGSGRDAAASADEPLVEAESDERVSDDEEAVDADPA